MAEAIIKGILKSKISYAPEIRISNISVSDIDENRRKYLEQNILPLEKDLINVNPNNRAVAKLSEIIILAVKPQNMKQVINELDISEGALVISIAAGITLAFLEKAFPNKAVIRAMPNNPALAGAGMTALAIGKNVSTVQVGLAKKIFGAVGEVIEVKERLMDAVTGLSGSGPAFVYLVIEAMTEAGEKLGIHKEVAEKLAIQTVLGSAQAANDMLKKGKSAKELREMVTSPGGTTIEGLKILERRKFAKALIEAVAAAAKKAKVLAK